MLTRRTRALCAAAAIGTLVWLPTVVSSGAQAAVAPRLVPAGTVAHAPKGARPLGPLSTRLRLDLGVVLRGRDPAGLARIATEVSTPGSAYFHHFVSPAGFAQHFGAPAGVVARVRAALQKMGLSVGPAPANDLLVPVEGDVATIERAFHTPLAAYRLADGSLGWAASSVPQVPAALGGSVTEVMGLDDLAVAHAALSGVGMRASSAKSPGTASEPHRNGGPVACHGAALDAANATGFTDADLARAYGLDPLYAKGDLAGDETIALFELESFSRADLATFDRCYFGASHTSLVSTDRIDGFALSGAGTGEAMLDLENLSALAPRAHVIVYEAPNTTFGSIDAFEAIVSQDRANIVTTSWGECEQALETSAPGAEQLENTLFEEAAAQGQTVFAATGDTGSDDCASTPFSSTAAVAPYLSVDDPASQPFVVAVGGTSLASARVPIAPGAQSAWNDGSSGGGGGGGMSSVWAAPAWQADSGVPGLLRGVNRQLPDVSAAADEQRGVTVYGSAFAAPAPGSELRPSPPGWSTIGGTSSSTPVWAAIAAEIAASGSAGTACSTLPETRGGRDLGFLSPELYSVASSTSGYSQSFFDVTRGDNNVFDLSSDSYAASAGFDLATGLGTPIVTEPNGQGGLSADLCDAATEAPIAPAARPAVLSLSPRSGPASGGSALSVTLDRAPGSGETLSVSVGGAPATVQSVSGSTLVVATPASPLTPGSPSFDGAGPAEVVVTESGPQGSYSSLVSSAAVFDYFGSSSGGPMVAGVEPSGGRPAGGNVVTIYGSGFSAPPPSVTFGGVASPSVVAPNDHTLSAVVPPRTSTTACATGGGFEPADACQVEVVVADPVGTSPTAQILPGLTGRVVFNPEGVIPPKPGTEVAPVITEYDYAPKPVITSITPAAGDARGEHPVTIHGRGFSLETFEWVNFGPPGNSTSEQVEIAWISGDKIVIAPPSASSAPPVRLPGGVSAQTVGGLSNVLRFSYAAVPRVGHLSVARGPTAGGTRLTVTGAELSAASEVRFIGESGPAEVRVVKRFAVHSATSLTVVTPPGHDGPALVEPCSASGCARPSASDTFVYGPSRT